jgi:uncharacterized protein (DUF952 family)
MDGSRIYKICTVADWHGAVRVGRYCGSEADRRDGFIHLSAAEQLSETARRHFGGHRDLVLVSVNVAALGDRLKWEPSRGGALFPHLYGDLPLEAVLRVDELPVDAAGRHQLPPVSPGS